METTVNKENNDCFATLTGRNCQNLLPGWAQMSPKRPQDGPKMAQEAPKTAQQEPKTAQEAPGRP